MSSEVSPLGCREELSPLRGSESRSLGQMHQMLPGGTSSSYTAGNEDASRLSEVLHVGCCRLKRFVIILKGKTAPEKNSYRILEIQILVFTYIHACKCGTWPRNFIQVSNLPSDSCRILCTWTKHSSQILHLQSGLHLSSASSGTLWYSCHHREVVGWFSQLERCAGWL